MFKPNRTRITPCYLFAFALILLHAATGVAATGKTEETIQIRADHMKFDMESGSSTYLGNVQITQGSIQLYGEKVIIQRKQDEIQHINIDGKPARYIQDDNTENKIYATSQHMQYLAEQERLVMTIDARLEQPNHTIESQRIVYDTKNKVVLAGQNNNQQGGRVNITLTPKKDNGDAPADLEKQ